MRLNLLFLIFTLSIFLFYAPDSARAQHLVKLNSDYSIDTFNNSRDWSFELNGNKFMTVLDLTVLDHQGLDYAILANDTETGKFYWVESKFDQFLDISEVYQENNIDVLWYDHKTCLAKIKNIKILPNELIRKYQLRRINFNHIRVQHDQNAVALKKPVYNESTLNFIQSILDSVSMDEIYLTEEHITGEKPFMLNGQLDSIKSRYSYSPQIFNAQNYLQSRFEDYGYTVEYLPFALGTFYDVQFYSVQPDYGWLVTTDKIFGTQNRGNSWTLQYQGTSGSDIWSVFVYDQNTAFAVGEFGTILKTSDGSTWQSLNSPTGAFLFGIHFKSNTLGWICGDSGLILKTTNGGTNWTTKSSSTGNRLYDIYFANDSTGWAVGRNGTIIHTTNYGENWTLQSTPTSTRLYGVHFLDENNGFAVGWDGVVLKTTNGGTNWTTMSVPLNSYFYDIDFVDQNTGMIVGWDGSCLTTTNGGSTWVAAGNISQKDMYGFDLLNANEAWAGGETMFASSSDFGSNWTARLDSIPSGSLINLIATKTGTLYPDQHYIICAHYDAITYNNPMDFAPGADDNGSGTAAVVEAARVLANYDFNYSIKFVLFPGEEQGLWGSEAYAANASATGEQIQGVINMDMIAYDSDDDGLVEIHAGTMSSSQTLGSFIVANISQFGLSLNAEYKTYGSSSASDHSSFWYFGFPAIMQIEDFQDFTPYYHSDNDLLSSLNLPYFLDNAKLSIASLALLAEADSITVTISEDDLSPSNFVLYDPYPNPFNPEVNIEYRLEKSQNISIDIFDILGKHIINIGSGLQQAGQYHIKWNGRNKHNEITASGIYLLKVENEESTAVKKLVLMR